jgi:hypothetical protein
LPVPNQACLNEEPVINKRATSVAFLFDGISIPGPSSPATTERDNPVSPALNINAFRGLKLLRKNKIDLLLL